jgi:transposase
MEMYCGIDLHATNSWLCVVDAAGQPQLEVRVPNHLEAVRARLEPYREQLSAVAVESTFNWYWLVDGLSSSGYPMRLANPSAMKRYEGLKYSDDRHDARWIAEMLRLGILPTGYIYPREARPVRDLLRHRARLVRNRTARLLTFQNLVGRETGRQISGNELKRLRIGDFAAFGLSPETNLALSSSLEIVELLDEKILEIEKVVMRGVKHRVEMKLLRTVGGIGQALGLTILLETGEIPRFRSVGHYASYSRLVRAAHGPTPQPTKIWRPRHRLLGRSHADQKSLRARTEKPRPLTREPSMSGTSARISSRLSCDRPPTN